MSEARCAWDTVYFTKPVKTLSSCVPGNSPPSSAALGWLWQPGSAMGERAQSVPSPPTEPNIHGWHHLCTPWPLQGLGIGRSIRSGFTALAVTKKRCHLLQCAQSSRNSACMSKREKQVEALAFRAAQRSGSTGSPSLSRVSLSVRGSCGLGNQSRAFARTSKAWSCAVKNDTSSDVPFGHRL